MLVVYSMTRNLLLPFPLPLTNANYQVTFEGFEMQNMEGAFLHTPN